MGKLLTFKGKHGTDSLNYQSIKDNGLQISENGSAGPGVYFWKDAPWAQELAIGWFVSHSSEDTFKQASVECLVITVCMNIVEEQHIDFTQHENKAKIYNLARKNSINTSNHRDLAPIFTMIAEERKEDTGLEVCLYEVELPAPKISASKQDKLKEKIFYQGNAFGRPPCYVAVDSAIIEVETSVTHKIA